MPQKTYFAVPTLDEPPNGNILLGQLITTPSQPTHSLAPPLPIPSTNPILHTSKKHWGAELSRTSSHRIGIWASFAASILGIGADALISWTASRKEIFQFEELETSFFEPSDEYVIASVMGEERKEVAEWIKMNPRKSVYMITGIKVARGAHCLVQKKKEMEVEFKPGVDAGPFSGVPVSAGPIVGGGRGKEETMWFVGGDEFVFAYRLRRVIVKRLGVKGSADYVKGATVAHRGKSKGGEDAASEKPPSLGSVSVEEDGEIMSVEQSLNDYGSGPYQLEGFEGQTVWDEDDDEECSLQIQEEVLAQVDES